jgi:protein-L-isoaspartate(D-aspartate) O-methyltransferase
VVTKRDATGHTISSISAPWLQTQMIELADLRPGCRVLEIGSGGYNAALIAEVVGAEGVVTSLDIDSDIVDRARAALTRTGYHQVQVVHGDGEYGYQANAPYHAIIVTAQAADVPPAWIEQLAPDGILVAPLRMRGNHRTLALTRYGDHLAATAVVVSGFVPMQGAGAHPEQRLLLRGDDIVLRADDTTTVADAGALTAALDQPRLDTWSPVTTPPGVPFDSLHLWLASQTRPYGLLSVDRDRVGDLIDPQNRVACPTLIGNDSIAYLATRKLDESTWQFGAHGFGPHANALTTEMLDLIATWDRDHRHGPGPRITIHPASATPAATNHPQLVIPRRHTTIAITWSAGRQNP